ncbi:hypothetical protein R3I94_011699 [Phoxinus phoxinus]
MVRPLGQDRKNKIKPLKGNAIGLNLLAKRTILTDQPHSTVNTKSKAQPYTRCFEQPFNFALQSSWKSDTRKPLTNSHSVDALSSNADEETIDTLADSLMDTQYEDLFSSVDTDAFVDHKKSPFKELIGDSSPETLQRKYRMRDEFGNIARRVRVTKKHVAQRMNSLTLNIRTFKVGTQTKIFNKSDAPTTQCTFTVDYIEIANKGRIKASDVMACEWCTVQKLPAMFLLTTPEIYLNLQGDCQSRNEKKKYVVLIFEKELTLPEQITLEEIFTEMGKRHNISCFPVKLSFEEANNRLKSNNCAQKPVAVLQPEEDELPVMSQIALLKFEEDDLPVMSQQALVPFSSSPDAPRCEIATLSVSDSDEDDLIELPSSPKKEIKKLVVYPPPPAKGGLTITEEDLNCLEEGEFLNDVILDFYLRYLVCEQQEKEDATKCHVFSSFFFNHLTQEDPKRLPGATGLSIQERRHNRVKTWTRNVNLFEKDFIFVPINQMAHWYLAVICFPGKISQTSDLGLLLNGRRHSVEYLFDQSPPNPMSLFYSPESSKQHSSWRQSIGDFEQSFCFLSDVDADVQAVKNRSVLNSVSKQPCILIMDSLTCSGRSSVVQILQEYLLEEWKVKMGSQQSFGKEVMKGWSPLVPQQDNFTDCGIYVLQYVESFLKDPPQTFHNNMDLKSWFSRRTVKKKRGQIKQLILGLHRQQTA